LGQLQRPTMLAMRCSSSALSQRQETQGHPTITIELKIVIEISRDMRH